MRKKGLVLCVAALLLTCALGRADFKFAQSGLVTAARGGAKEAQATVVTTCVKGSYLRIDLADGSYGIVDLNGRRDIQIDSTSHTYSIVTFDAIRAADEAYEKQVVGWHFNPRAIGKKQLPNMNGRAGLRCFSAKARANWPWVWCSQYERTPRHHELPITRLDRGLRARCRALRKCTSFTRSWPA